MGYPHLKFSVCMRIVLIFVGIPPTFFNLLTFKNIIILPPRNPKLYIIKFDTALELCAI